MDVSFSSSIHECKHIKFPQIAFIKNEHKIENDKILAISDTFIYVY